MNSKTKFLILGIVSFSFLIVSGFVYAAGPANVNLGSADNYTVLSKSGISTTGTTLITGNIGVSPTAAGSITGFSLTTPGVFSTSSYVTGKVYAADYAVPSPSNLTTAISDMETAYTDAAGRTLPTATELGSGDISGLTIAPGLYKWGTGVSINSDVTLSGTSNDIWIFQIAQDLTVASGKKVILAGGASAKNIFWQVGGQATLGTTSHFEGTILSKTLIAVQTGASINGGLYAQTAVTLQSSTVNKALVELNSVPPVEVTPVTNTNNNSSSNSNSSSTPTTSENQATPAVPATPAVTTLTNTSGTTTIYLKSNGQTQVVGNSSLSAYLASGNWSVLKTSAIPATPANPSASMLERSPNLNANIIAFQAVSKNLRHGSMGDYVKFLQNILTEKGFNIGNIDGIFGPKTNAGVVAFQIKNGLSVDGIVGPITKAELIK